MFLLPPQILQPGRRPFLSLVLLLSFLILSASGVLISPQEQYSPPEGWAGKLVLAELFTGSECPPCLGADLGFDRLLEHYPGSVLAVLQYHQHIPLPDPMANPHSRERLDYYGARATPSAFIDGRFVGASGGDAGAAGWLFGIYSKKAERQLKETPPLEITLNARLNGTVVEVSVTLNTGEEMEEYRDPSLYIVLAERELSYYGYSAQPVHTMVVRHMIGGSGGHPVSFTDGVFSLDQTADLVEISSGLYDYLVDFEERKTGGIWGGFSAYMHEIDPANLMVVAFVQEGRRNRVLQTSQVVVKE